MIENGGLLDQPAWFLDLLAWFLPRLEEIKFTMKCEKVLGSVGSGGIGGIKQR